MTGLLNFILWDHATGCELQAVGVGHEALLPEPDAGEWIAIEGDVAAATLALVDGALVEVARPLPPAIAFEVATAASWEALRTRRDALLQASDWTQMLDQPEARRLAWQPYRQALRDLPEMTSDLTSPDWPAPPL